MSVPYVPTEKELAELLDACPRHTLAGARDRAAILVTIDTGARPAELLSTFPGDLDIRDPDRASIVTANVKRKPRTLKPGADVDAATSKLTARVKRLPASERRSLLLLAKNTGRTPVDSLDRRESLVRFIGPRTAYEAAHWLELREKLLGARGKAAPLFVTTRAAKDNLAAARGRTAQPSEAGSGVSVAAFRESLAARSRTAGLPHAVTPRTLRHYAACRAYRKAKDLLLVRDLLGHASAQTTEIYLRSLGVTDEDERRSWLHDEPKEAPAPDPRLAQLEALTAQLAELRASIEGGAA